MPQEIERRFQVTGFSIGTAYAGVFIFGTGTHGESEDQGRSGISYD